MKGLYAKTNFSERYQEYQMEIEIRSGKQDDLSIQDSYNVLIRYWDQLAMKDPQFPEDAASIIQKYQK